MGGGINGLYAGALEARNALALVVLMKETILQKGSSDKLSLNLRAYHTESSLKPCNSIGN